MKKAILISILSCLLLACNDESSSSARAVIDETEVILSCAPDRRAETDYLDTEGNYHSLFNGYHIGDMWNYTWYRENGSGYVFGVDSSNRLKKVNHGFVYADSNCSDLKGEVYDYPIHLQGDTYVFKFEETLYEYAAGYPLTSVGPYWFKNEYGECNPCEGTAESVRMVTPHLGSGISLAY